MAKHRLPNATEQTVFIFQLPAELKADVYSIAAKRGEPASVVVREFIRRGVGDAA